MLRRPILEPDGATPPADPVFTAAGAVLEPTPRRDGFHVIAGLAFGPSTIEADGARVDVVSGTWPEYPP